MFVAVRCFNAKYLLVRSVQRQPSHDVAVVGHSSTEENAVQSFSFSFFFLRTGQLKCAKVKDYNLETVEATAVVTEAKENSFPTVTSALLCKVKRTLLKQQ